MKRHPALSIPIVLTLVLAAAPTARSQPGARPGAAPRAGAAKAPRDRFAPLIQEVEGIYGKPLTEPQKKAVIAAAVERTRVMKAASDKFRASVARTLGLSEQQLTAKERAFFQKQFQRRGGRPPTPAPKGNK